MSIDIRTEEMPNNVHVLHVVGRITQGEGAQALRDALVGLGAKSPEGRIILDLAGVQYIDSTGMGELVSGYIKAQRTGQRIVLSGLSEKVREVFELTKLRSIFDVYDGVESAKEAVTRL
jgi:anti-sigma B factor antagonist